MVALAGGRDALARPGTDSARIPWHEVVAWAPEVLVLCPCGFSLAQAVAQAGLLAAYPGWTDCPPLAPPASTPSMRVPTLRGRGPRVVEGTELLAHLIHPELFAWHGPEDAFGGLISMTSRMSHGAFARLQRIVAMKEAPLADDGYHYLATQGIWQKSCPKCGQPFDCGPQDNQRSCWCEVLPPIMPTEDGTDCRCPTCLAIDIRHQYMHRCNEQACLSRLPEAS